MKIIISPARRMKSDPDSLPYDSLPQYLEQSQDCLLYTSNPSQLNNGLISTTTVVSLRFTLMVNKRVTVSI